MLIQTIKLNSSVYLSDFRSFENMEDQPIQAQVSFTTDYTIIFLIPIDFLKMKHATFGDRQFGRLVKDLLNLKLYIDTFTSFMAQLFIG